MYVATTLL